MTKDILLASELKGFCSIRLCWQFLHDVSDALSKSHTTSKVHGCVDLNHIAIDGQHFVLMEGTGTSTPASDTWNLAASAMELVLGSPLFNGAGEASQKANTPIPTLPYSGTERLNILLHRCLDVNVENRPSMAEINRIALEVLENNPSKGREPRIFTSQITQEKMDKTDCQWPEKMVAGMKKAMTFFILLMMFPIMSYSQNPLNEKEEIVTIKLMNAVLLLRQHDIKSWNLAQDELEKRLSQITLMNEITDKNNDCQVKLFGVNRLVTELKNGRKILNPGKELLDSRTIHYSLYEKGIKKGCTSTATLTGRTGKQVFLVIPFSRKQPYATELRKNDGTLYTPIAKDANGITYYLIDTDTGPAKGETLTLKITNKDTQQNVSFVVINHNYHNRP